MKIVKGINKWKHGDLALVVKSSYGVSRTKGNVVEILNVNDPYNNVRAYVHTGKWIGNLYWFAHDDLRLLERKP
jgi:hypothetical protein